MVSATFEEARKQNESLMAGGVALTFPAFDDLPEKQLFLGTRNLEGDDGEKYSPALAEMPFLRSQRGIGNDSLEFSISDGESIWYQEIKPYEDVLIDSEIIAREFLKTKLDIFESEIIFNGFLQQMTLNESNMQLQFSAISDMSRSGFLVGGRILTQRYCAAKFNKNGSKNPLYDACGWTTSQGGNPLFCTHKLKGADGCADHFNDWRILAVEALTTAEITTTAGAGGWQYGGCFAPQTLVWMADGSYKPIWKIEAKKDHVMSFKADGSLCRRKVTKTFVDLSDFVLVFDFAKRGFLELSAAQQMCIATDRFQAAGAIEAGQSLHSRNKNGWFDFLLRNNWLKERRTRLHTLAVWGTNTFFVHVGGVNIGVHNRKNPDDILI